MLRELLDEMKRQRHDYRNERDDWKTRAEQLLTFQEATKTAKAPQGVADILNRMRERQTAARRHAAPQGQGQNGAVLRS